ncbi:MAG: CDP-alcohol phosphatidyltransferase family protein [Clostridia bacterium]|nr:CDP-alcohol phosphatidyltransferase family protein [Clostridia bacterium]
MANIITGIRIVLSVALLFFPAFSPAFYALYLTAGLSDMIDSTVARKTGKESEFGAKLDTAADLVFFSACLIKLLPTLQPPIWLYVWTGLIALIKAVNVVSGYAVRKKWIAPHTVMNKVAGLLLFALPLTVSWIELKYSAAVVCAVATFAAIQEGHLIRTGRD